MRRLLILSATLLCLLLPAAPAFAYNPLGTACNSGASGSAVCSAQGSSNPIAGPNGVLKKATIIIAILAGIAAVIVIIVSGLRIVTAGGNEQTIASARTGIIGALVGLVIILVAASIITFVVSRI